MSEQASFHPHLTAPSFAQLCVLAHHTYDYLGDDADAGDVLDALKWACAAARFDYSGDGVRKAVDAVAVARQKGYRTPTERGSSNRIGRNVYVRPPAFSRDELRAAEGWIRAIGGCPHEPRCTLHERCVALAARYIRDRRRA